MVNFATRLGLSVLKLVVVAVVAVLLLELQLHHK
jgi:hypothetical protein